MAILGGILSVALIGVYNGLWYNRYFPLPEGWFSVYADMMRKGMVPYRDFYCFVPPLYPLFISAVQAVLGTKIIMLRIVGLVIAWVSTGVLYTILRSCFGTTSAFLATVVGMIYYESSVVFIDYDFLQVMTAAGLLACLLILRFHKAAQSAAQRKQASAWAICAGCAAGIALFTKQSNGVFICCFAGIAVIIAGGTSGRSWALRGALLYICGFSIVACSLCIWLLVHGALGACIGAIGGGGVSSKGGLMHIFFGFVPDVFKGDMLSRSLVLFILSLPFGLASIWALRMEPLHSSRFLSKDWGIAALLFAAAGLSLAILGPWYLGYGADSWAFGYLQYYADQSMIPAAIIGVLLIFCSTAENAYRLRSLGNRPLVIPALVASGFFWGNGTSGGIDGAGAFLAFSLFFAMLLHHGGYFRIGGVAVAIVMIMQASIFTENKYHVPYNWWGVEGEVDMRSDEEKTNQPLLSGLWVAPAENRILDGITGLIKSNTREGERILIFPQTPIFYLLANRPMMGTVVSHWFDVLPDNVALMEKDLLERKPPAMIILMQLPEYVWHEHERAFRQGQRCAQREILDTIVRMQAEGKYEEIATFQINEDHMYRVLKRK
jgi:hypothetical protein